MDTDESELRFLCTDPDPRIRARAIRNLEEKCMQSRQALTMDSYLTIRDLCSNSSMNVRLSALRILERLAQQHPDIMINNQLGHEVRVHDDAFSVVCHAINDLETFVRAEAAELLGRFQLVSNNFLHQTLDKKLLTPMKIQKDGTTQNGSRNSWNTGKTLGESARDIPDDDDENTALLPTNTCGAFVTALEDEFEAVRLPAVNSLSVLAKSRPDFAFAAVDHLSDMFNDEMYEVRLASIKALAPILVCVKINQVQLDCILSVLSDATPNTRIALHELLAHAKFADSECINRVMKSLMISMHRFPRDRDSIFKCISQIARHHACLIHALIPGLFRIHPIFEPQEQDVNDDFYLAHLILALNAAAIQQPIRPLVPKYAIRHYRYIRHSMPFLIPAIEEFEQRCTDKPLTKKIFINKPFLITDSLVNQESENIPTETIQAKDSDKQLEYIYQQISEAYSSLISDERVFLLNMIMKELLASENIVEEELSTSIRLLRLMCELLISYDSCIRRRYNDEAATFNVIEESLQLITHIRHLFNNINNRILLFLAECEFHLKVEYLFLKLGSEDEEITDAIVLERTSQEIEKTKNVIAELGLECTPQTRQLIEWLSNFTQSHIQRAQLLIKSGNKKLSVSFLSSETIWAIQKLVECRLNIPKDMPNLRNCNVRSMRIIELTDTQGHPINYTGMGPDSIHRFVAGLPTAIRLHTHIFNLPDTELSNFRVQIVYPNDLHIYQKPETSQLVKLSERLYRLDMNLIISAEHWAEPSDITIRCGLLTKKHSEKDISDSRDFVPLLDADKLSHPNLIQLRIHPMLRC